MNIGLFTDTFFPQLNGVGTSTLTLAKTLRELGHNVYIFTPKDPNQTEPDDEFVIRMNSMPAIFIKQYRLGLVYSPRTLMRISQLDLDIVHTQTEFSLGMFGKFLAKYFQVPVVHTYHTMYVDYVHYIVNGALITPPMAIEFSKLFCDSVNAVIAPTKKVKDVLDSYGVKRPISIIPTGINIDKFRRSNFNKDDITSLKSEIGISNDDNVVIYIGRLAKEKSVDVIIKSMPSVIEKLPNTKLVIVGGGPEAENLKEEARSLEIEQSVIFTGPKPWEKIGMYYQLGDVFTTASTSETQGLTFIEAMAAGVTVVAKRDASIEDVIENNVNGFMFDNDDELPELIFKILTDKNLKKSITKKAVEYAENISDKTFGKSVEALYYDILDNPEKYSKPYHIRDIPIMMGRNTAAKLKATGKSIARIAAIPIKTIKK